MLSGILSIYSLKFPEAIVYMLQATEYEPGPYLRWLIKVDNFNTVIYRKSLVMTKPAKMLLWFLKTGIFVQVLFALFLIYKTTKSHHQGLVLAVVFLASAP